MVVDINCIKHNKPYEFICTKCNVLLCTICNNLHLRDNRDHNCFHIDEIKQSFLNLNNFIYSDNNNIDNNNIDNNNQEGQEEDNNNINLFEFNFKKEIENIWNSIKSESYYLKSLELKENEIINHFKQFHEYLFIEEYKLKSTIVNEINNIKNQANQHINQLKSLINILNINNNNKHHRDNEKYSIDLEQQEDEDEEDEYLYHDRTSNYSIETMIKTIQDSETICQFLKVNSKTIFNNNQHHQLDYQNHDIDSLVLESLYKHNLEFNQTIDYKQQQREYNIIIDNQSIKNVKQLILESIKLQQDHIDQIDQINKSVKKKLILSANREGKKITLFDTDNNNEIIEEINFENNSYWTVNSIANIGEYLYIFGGFVGDNSSYNQYIRYSVHDKKIDYQGVIDEIDGGLCISVCYDEQDYIYLIGGFNFVNRSYVKRIDRFNIRTMKFEKYFHFDQINSIIIGSFFYNGFIYILPCDNKIYQFNPNSKEINVFTTSLDLFKDPKSACTDGNGKIYILSQSKKFLRLDLETKDIVHLKPIDSVNINLQAMVYVASGENERIYVLGGNNNNCIYTIIDNQWSFFYLNDPYNRIYCGAVLI